MRAYSIAMVAACPFPANHGTPAAIKEMSEELARRGHSIRVVTYPLSHDIPVVGVEIDRVAHVGSNREVNVGPSYQRLIFDALLLVKLFQIVRRHQVDLIHAHNYEAMLIGGVVGRLTGVPVIYNAINTMISELPSYNFLRPRALATGLAKALDFVVPRMADVVIADTEELSSFVLDQGVEPERVITIHSGVRPEMFQAGDGAHVRERFAVGGGLLIIYTGTLDEFQGLDNLMAAFQIVYQRKPAASLLLVGSTIKASDRAKYQRMAAELGFASHFGITSCTLEELPDFLAAADVAVVPRPNSPGIPTKLLNYMAAGNAIVSFRGSATILQHRVTAFLVEPPTAGNFAQGILSVLDDPALAQKLRTNAQSFVLGRFDWPSIATRLEAVYGRLARKSPAMRQKIVGRDVRTRDSRGRFSAPRKRSHWVVFLVVCCFLGLLVFLTVLHMINTDARKARIIRAPTPVETVPVRRQTLKEVIGGSGTVEQSNTVLLTTQISARVLEVPVKIGDIVKKGDLLARWDDRLIQATLEANRQFVETSNIKIKNETRQVERYTTLEKKHMGTPLDLEKAEIALADAREELAKATLGLRQAEIALEHAQMRSPIDGIVLERLVNPGETTHNDQVVIKLGALETVLMAAKVTEEKIHSVQLGLSAEISFPAFPAETFQGKVFKIDPNIDPVTRTFTSYVEINNPDLRLKPGLSGFARIHRTAKDVPAVPSVAIINPSGDQASVFVVDNSGHANLRKVGLGVVVNAMTEVTGGLKEGEKVVTVGQLYLQENDKVHSTSKSNIAK